MKIVNAAALNTEQAERLAQAVIAASERWKAAFNSGNAQGAAAAYEQNARMVAKPLADVTGRDAIEAFWADLIAKGFAEVEYVEPELTLVDAESARLASGWRMNNAQGVITNELWRLQADGTALLAEDEFEVRG